nr:MAG TPA: hypothetical protein [Caudoviricetes sp.]
MPVRLCPYRISSYLSTRDADNLTNSFRLYHAS